MLIIKNIPLYYKIAIIYALILFLDRTDITIINVAIPTMSKVFNIDIALTDWLSSSFLIGLSIAIGVSVWLGESYGYKKIFIAAVFGFAIFSVACSLSTTFIQFVVCRFLQGICGGIVIPTGSALLYMSCEKKDYGKVTNFVFLPALVAPAVAPYLGGVLIKYFSYQAIFFINLPICLAIAILSSIIIKEQYGFHNGGFDFLGFLISSLTYLSFFAALSYMSQNLWLYASGVLALSLFLGYILIRIEHNLRSPLFNFKYFKHEFFRKTTIVQLFFQMSHFGSFFIIGLYLQVGIGFTPEKAGFIIAMQALGAMLILVPARKLFYKKGAIVPIAGGLIGISVTTPLILLISTNLQIVPACIIMFARGMSSGWIGTPLQTISMFDANVGKEDVGRIGGMFSIARQLSISMGICVSTVMVGVVNSIYKFNYFDQTLGYANSLRLFSISILGISIFCWVGAYVATSLDNQKIMSILNNK